MKTYEDGDVIVIDGMRFLVVFIEYIGSYGSPFIKHIELKGIKE